MRHLFLVLIALSSAVSSSAQNDPAPKLPPEQQQLRDRLESMSSIVQLTCGLMMPILPGEIYESDGRKRQMDNSKYRLSFYRTAIHGGTAKLSYICSTDEGHMTRDYLLAQNGKYTRIADFSRDPFGGNRFITWECTDLRLAHHVKKPDGEIVIELLKETEIRGKVLWLSCNTNEGRIAF